MEHVLDVKVFSSGTIKSPRTSIIFYDNKKEHGRVFNIKNTGASRANIYNGFLFGERFISMVT